MQIIRTENLKRDFRVGEEVINIIKDVNLSIEKGKLTILRGRSGSGKTTLMNLLGTLDKPTK
jgi:putative ABC transport system ATP-binding protein